MAVFVIVIAFLILMCCSVMMFILNDLALCRQLMVLFCSWPILRKHHVIPDSFRNTPKYCSVQAEVWHLRMCSQWCGDVKQSQETLSCLISPVQSVPLFYRHYLFLSLWHLIHCSLQLVSLSALVMCIT